MYTALTDELVFKGETALFFFYGLDRFSEDLDFTRIKHYDQDKLKTTMSDMFTVLHIIHELKTEKSIAGKTFKIKAQGPLYKDPLSESIISIEISERKDIALLPDIREVVPMYDDLRPFTFPVVKKEEILAEKIIALIIRGKARDLYDISFLLKKEIPLDDNLINKKLSYYKKTFDEEEFKHQAKSIKNIWQSELHGLLPKIPKFDNILDFILKQLKH